jgi:ADP-ribosylglycohydrolase
MKKIFKEWDNICTHLQERVFSFNKGLNVGDYTDDTEQSIGLARSILKSDKLDLDFESFIQNMLDVFDEYRKENNGVCRVGYGEFGDISKINDIPNDMGLKSFDRVTRMRLVLNKKMAMTKPPGNGALMRLNPLIFVDRENADYFHYLILRTKISNIVNDLHWKSADYFHYHIINSDNDYLNVEKTLVAKTYFSVILE